MNNIKTLSGWGLYPKIDSHVYEIKNYEENLNYLSYNFIARGNGRSYGDSSLGRNVISTLNLNQITNFDKKMEKLFYKVVHC